MARADPFFSLGRRGAFFHGPGGHPHSYSRGGSQVRKMQEARDRSEMLTKRVIGLRLLQEAPFFTVILPFGRAYVNDTDSHRQLTRPCRSFHDQIT
jgi:hypothetical protein